jgi:hypothetical protein
MPSSRMTVLTEAPGHQGTPADTHNLFFHVLCVCVLLPAAKSVTGMYSLVA